MNKYSKKKLEIELEIVIDNMQSVDFNKEETIEDLKELLNNLKESN